MTLEIKRGKLPSELIGVVHAEHNEETGTAVIDVSNLVEVHALVPHVDKYRCDNPLHGVEIRRYFAAKDVKRCGHGGSDISFAPSIPRLVGTLLGQDGSADFVLYY